MIRKQQNIISTSKYITNCKLFKYLNLIIKFILQYLNTKYK